MATRGGTMPNQRGIALFSVGYKVPLTLNSGILLPLATAEITKSSALVFWALVLSPSVMLRVSLPSDLIIISKYRYLPRDIPSKVKKNFI